VDAANTDHDFNSISQSGEPYDLSLIGDFLPTSSPATPGAVALRMMARVKALRRVTGTIAFIDPGIRSIEKGLRAGPLATCIEVA
jgi:hypothetical protein